MSAKKLVEHFAGLDDPRCNDKIEHLLIDILVIAVRAVIAGAERWVVRKRVVWAVLMGECQSYVST